MTEGRRIAVKGSVPTGSRGSEDPRRRASALGTPLPHYEKPISRPEQAKLIL